MKPPSKSIPRSLSGQTPPGRRVEMPSVTKPRKYAPSMTVPGDGSVSRPPGNHTDERQGRSAAVAGIAAGRMVGGRG